MSEQPAPTPEPKHDIFTDPALARPFTEDPLFRFLKRHWKHLLLAVGAALAIVYTRNVFEETRTAELERAGDIMNRVRSEYATLGTLEGELASRQAAVTRLAADPRAEGKAKEEAAGEAAAAGQKLDESRRRLESFLLALSDTRPPYRDLVPLYRTLIARAGNDEAKVRETLPLLAPAALSKPEAQERFVEELRALVAGRLLIDDDATLGEARARLKLLASEGAYVQVPAALSLSRIARSPEDRAEARTLLETIASKQPEQLALLQEELDRLRGQ